MSVVVEVFCPRCGGVGCEDCANFGTVPMRLRTADDLLNDHYALRATVVPDANRDPDTDQDAGSRALYADPSHPDRDLADWGNSSSYCFGGFRRDSNPPERGGSGHDRDTESGRAVAAGENLHPPELGNSGGLRPFVSGSRSEVSGEY